LISYWLPNCVVAVGREQNIWLTTPLSRMYNLQGKEVKVCANHSLFHGQDCATKRSGTVYHHTVELCVAIPFAH